MWLMVTKSLVTIQLEHLIPPTTMQPTHHSCQNYGEYAG